MSKNKYIPLKKLNLTHLQIQISRCQVNRKTQFEAVQKNILTAETRQYKKTWYIPFLIVNMIAKFS